jgi:prevent-host-death family protein
MKVIALREAKATLSGCVEAAQRDRILITKHGRPAALVIGVEGEKLEDLFTVANPRFWELIETRRRSRKTVPLAEVRHRLRLTAKAKGHKSPARGSRAGGSKLKPTKAQR